MLVAVESSAVPPPCKDWLCTRCGLRCAENAVVLCFAVATSFAAPVLLYRAQKAAQRDRASAIRTASDPLLSHVTDRLLDRLEDCVAKFPTAVILGGAGRCSSACGWLTQHRAAGYRVKAVIVHGFAPGHSWLSHACQPRCGMSRSAVAPADSNACLHRANINLASHPGSSHARCSIAALLWCG